ncbi:hypothetical protein A3D36_02675 [Candidatus Nomurabacteria bacterium RIFCSPHIGHO2_02_FULL_36_29]|nr:MAG: hypothetical protein A3D36_02675 [Candidatus Nomurabacteria bacterium RIFCSPHIGHO2_02_FULL_36_29]
MDIFSHGLYGGVAVGRASRRDYVTAFLFGIGPDFLAFGTFFITSLISTGTLGRPNLETIPSYVFTIYDFTHSLVIYVVFFAFLWFFGKKHFAKLTLAWPLHILVDIPTHDVTFFPTPFLWPISDFYIDGASWGQPLIFIPNVIVLSCLYGYWYVRRKRTLSRS